MKEFKFNPCPDARSNHVLSVGVIVPETGQLLHVFYVSTPLDPDELYQAIVYRILKYHGDYTDRDWDIPLDAIKETTNKNKDIIGLAKLFDIIPTIKYEEKTHLKIIEITEKEEKLVDAFMEKLKMSRK